MRAACRASVALSIISIFALAGAGCAHDSPRSVASRALVGAGATAMIVGALMAAGCSEASVGDGCTSSGGDGDPGVGLPVMVAGAALIATGVATRPKDKGPKAKRAAPVAATTAPNAGAAQDPAPKKYSPGPRLELLSTP